MFFHCEECYGLISVSNLELMILGQCPEVALWFNVSVPFGIGNYAVHGFTSSYPTM